MGTEHAAEMTQRSYPRGIIAATQELWNYRDLLRHLVSRELKVKYKRSTLGWIWSLANPLLVAGVFTLVFSLFLRIDPPIGERTGLHSFPLFLLCALLPWNFTSNVLTQSTVSIVGGSDLVRKVYFPRAVLVLAQVLAVLVSFMIELVVLMVLLTLAGARPTAALVALPLLLLIQAVFVAGIGALVASLNVFLRDLQHLLGILLMMWFYATPVIYPPDQIPTSASVLGFEFPARAIMGVNPMAAFVQAYRDVLYHGRFPSWGQLMYLASLSLIVLLVCFRLFRKLEPRFAEEV